jgi:hypothetical protein
MQLLKLKNLLVCLKEYRKYKSATQQQLNHYSEDCLKQYKNYSLRINLSVFDRVNFLQCLLNEWEHTVQYHQN